MGARIYERTCKDEFEFYAQPSAEVEYWEATKGKKRSERRKNKRIDIEEIPTHIPKYQQEQLHVLNEFEERSWAPGNKGMTVGFKGIDKALDRLQRGFHIIAGDSNIGKTAFVSQMSYNVAKLNPDAYVLDFSLDDPMDEKISRVIASANRILINAVKTPNKYKKLKKMLERRKDGLRELRRMANCYKCYDQTHGSDVDKIKETIKRHIVELKEAGEERKVVVFIDNFHDLTTTARVAQQSDKQKYDYLAQYISDMATELDVAIVCTAEFKKLNGFRRPGIDDIRESVKIKYEAKSIMLCYNEVSLKGEAASVYFEKMGDPAKQPIYEVKFAKNKYTKFKGRVFFEGYPEMAFFIEADDQSTKRYNHAIYSNE